MLGHPLGKEFSLISNLNRSRPWTRSSPSGSVLQEGPELGTGFEWPQQGRAQGDGRRPGPAGHTVWDTSQAAAGRLGQELRSVRQDLPFIPPRWLGLTPGCPARAAVALRVSCSVAFPGTQPRAQAGGAALPGSSFQPFL